jgi:uncharacterized membrane protein YeaQ/YmgE (transglycosylase-associated protein family)
MALISWIGIGLVAGLLARWLMPGSGPGGLLVTTILGMAGASIGGFLVGFIGGTGPTGFTVWSILVATFGAAVLLFLYSPITRRTV